MMVIIMDSVVLEITVTSNTILVVIIICDTHIYNDEMLDMILAVVIMRTAVMEIIMPDAYSCNSYTAHYA